MSAVSHVVALAGTNLGVGRRSGVRYTVYGVYGAWEMMGNGQVYTGQKAK